MASDFLGNFPYKKNLNLDLNNFVKKREINIFLLNIILRPGTTFMKDYFAFSAEQLERKMEKRRESQERVKEEQRGLFLKETVKKSKDAEKKRNEINKDVGYKKQVFIFDS